MELDQRNYTIIPPRTRPPLFAPVVAEVAYIMPLRSSLDKGPSGLVFVTFPDPIQPIKAFFEAQRPST